MRVCHNLAGQLQQATGPDEPFCNRCECSDLHRCRSLFRGSLWNPISSPKIHRGLSRIHRPQICSIIKATFKVVRRLKGNSPEFLTLVTPRQRKKANTKIVTPPPPCGKKGKQPPISDFNNPQQQSTRMTPAQGDKPILARGPMIQAAILVYLFKPQPHQPQKTALVQQRSQEVLATTARNLHSAEARQLQAEARGWQSVQAKTCRMSSLRRGTPYRYQTRDQRLGASDWFKPKQADGSAIVVLDLIVHAF